MRDDIEMSVARAAFHAQDYQGTTALVPTILAGLALIVAVSSNVDASTAILVAIAVAGFLGLLAKVHIAKRNQEAANAVLHYRIDHHLPILKPDGDDTRVAEG